MRPKAETPNLPVHFCASVLGCTERQVRQMMLEGALAKAGISLVTPGSLLDELARRRGGAAYGEEDYEAARRRKMIADADAAEIATARDAGALVLASEVAGALEPAIAATVERLAHVGPSIGAAVILEQRAQAAAEMISKANRAACESIMALDLAEIVKKSQAKRAEAEETPGE